MKIGFPNNPRKNILEEIEWTGKNGFDFVDLFLEEDKAVPEKIDVEKTKRLLQKYKLDVVGHTAWYLPIGSPSRSLREAAVSEAIRYFAIFSKLGVGHVTIHANWPPAMFSEEEGIELQVESLKKLITAAKKYKIEVMYEPIDGRRDTPENIEKILKAVPDLHLHVDTGHMNLFGRKPDEVIERFHKRIVHVHLHDNNCKEDLHLPMGCGKINWEKTLRILKKYYNGTITLEIFSRDKDYVLLSKDKLRKMWNEK